MKIFNLLTSDIENLSLKLDGKLPVDRDELLALANSHGRIDYFFTKDKNGDEIEIKFCKAKEKYDLSKLDVSKIINFDSIFYYSKFNGDINSWDVSNAISMNRMFTRAKEFNQNINSWDVSKITSMYAMFYNTEKFNQPLDNWNTSKVTDMSYVFAYTNKFNSPLDKWNVSKVTSMRAMFGYAKAFNQNLNSWDILKVNNMDYMFKGAKAFNQPILWDLSKDVYSNGMFLEIKSFKDRFNEGKNLPYFADEIKKWLKENRNKMIAIDIEDSKGKELDNFLSNFNVIDSANLNGLHNVIDSANLNGLHNVIDSTKLNELYNNKDIIIN